MPIMYYLIPTEPPPYTRGAGERPKYCDTIRCNWTGHPLWGLDYYVCKVNTTSDKHAQLNAQPGVIQIPYAWDTVIATLPIVKRTAIQNWLTNKGLPYDPNETIGELLMRVVNSGIFSFGSRPLDTRFADLTQAQKDKIIALCTRMGLPIPADDETLRDLSRRIGRVTWNGDELFVEEY